MEAFQLEEEVFARFLREIEDGYVDNPYHSATHAAGVLQVTHMLVQNGLIQSGVLDDNLQLSCYLAAICHDHAHPGLTNDFLIKTRHRTALVYNVRSPPPPPPPLQALGVVPLPHQAKVCPQMQCAVIQLCIDECPCI